MNDSLNILQGSGTALVESLRKSVGEQLKYVLSDDRLVVVFVIFVVNLKTEEL